MWSYGISSHVLSHNGSVVTTDCYSGLDPHKNDPRACMLSEIGPIPPGTYTIGKAEDHPVLGPLAMPLTPLSANTMFGRDGFYLHGDSIAHPGSASHGCIILPHHVRSQISQSAMRAGCWYEKFLVVQP